MDLHRSWVRFHAKTEPVPDKPMVPAIPTKVENSLTICFIVLYGLLFLLVYTQLFLILYYKHKRFSYQTVFLYLCLIWAGLRTTLFSFYIHNDVVANKLDFFFHWLLFSFPVCLQFTTLCLLVLYFAQVLFKAKAQHKPNEYEYHRKWSRIIIIAVIIAFLTTNITCAMVPNPENQRVILARVIISGVLFVGAGISLSVCIWKVYHMTSANVLLEARGTTPCQATLACTFIVLLYTSRAVYNIIAVTDVCPSFGFGWINVSDQADLGYLKGTRFLVFGIVLFVWEFLPTFIVVIFFRVRKFASNVNLPHIMPDSVTPSRAYFFDNPRRYDSDDDLSRTHSSATTLADAGRDIPSIPNTPINSSTPSRFGYGTIIRTSSSYPTGQSRGQYGMPGMSPTRLFSNNVSIGGYNQIYD
ncbi:G protein-coupled receptor 137Ba-like [Amphiura filiformis]|uniref:G protein-coupled receptor 137Ba-like n=1 Tax=Amphiura filiformis TaxID=82378 RepID=UPI003B219C63